MGDFTAAPVVEAEAIEALITDVSNDAINRARVEPLFSPWIVRRSAIASVSGASRKDRPSGPRRALSKEHETRPLLLFFFEKSSP